MLKPKHLAIALLVAFVSCFLSSKVLANDEKILIKNISFTPQNHLEILLSKKDTFKVFTLSEPNRLVVDISNAELEDPSKKPTLPSFIASFRSKKNENSLRIVFDLKQKITIEKVKFEKLREKSGKITAEISGPKISVESKSAEKSETLSKPDDFISSKVEEFSVTTTKVVNIDGSATYLIRKTPKSVIKSASGKIPVIVIDAGHGGKDPGTIGNYARSKEKNITLSYAKELGKQLGKTGRYKVYLTRDTDIFIPLKKRVELARRKKADMFISLHANAISDPNVSGFSIYTLSEKSSDKQAELLAQKENRADIISGVNFSGASLDIMKTLIDLSQREAMNGSARFANIAITSVRQSSINILQNTHRFAGFAVLTAPDMASTLIELGYLSNKDEEKLMNSLAYKRLVAQSLVNAIDEYFAKNKTN
jgi:N-acetylmuramoyl-L-alanine amidase